MVSVMDIFKATAEIDKLLSNDSEMQLLNKMLILECKHNLNLISCLKSDIHQSSDEILSIVKLMEVEVLSLYITETVHNKSILSKVKDKFRDDVDNETENLVENTLLKIKILKSIAELSYEGKSGYRKFRLKTRLENLKKKLCLLIESLGGF